MDNSFEKNLDRITVDEVVFQFMQQVYLGADFKPNNDNTSAETFKGDTKLIDFLNKMYTAIPPTIGDNLAKSNHIVINAPKGSIMLESTVQIFVGNADDTVVVKAYLENSGFDITDLCVKSVSGDTVTFSFGFNAPFSQDDNIIIFYK